MLPEKMCGKAEIPVGYRFTASNVFTERGMMWSITVEESKDPDFAVWRILTELSKFSGEFADQHVIIKGFSLG